MMNKELPKTFNPRQRIRYIAWGLLSLVLYVPGVFMEIFEIIFLWLAERLEWLKYRVAVPADWASNKAEAVKEEVMAPLRAARRRTAELKGERND